MPYAPSSSRRDSRSSASSPWGSPSDSPPMSTAPTGPLLTRHNQGVEHPSRLVMAEKPVSYFYVESYCKQKSVFAGVAAFQTGVPFNVRLPGEEDGKQQPVGEIEVA